MKRDWPTLKLEFLNSKETLNEFRIRHKISNQRNFYKQTAGWSEERKNLVRKSLDKAVEKIGKKLTEEFTVYPDMFMGSEAVLAKYIREALQNDLEPSQFNYVVQSLCNLLKHKKLLFGEPTEITENKGEGSKHVHIVQVLQMLKKGEIIEIDDDGE